MSSNPEVIRLYTGIEIDLDLIEEAQRECDGQIQKAQSDGVNLKTVGPSIAFPPGKKATKVIDSVKKRLKRSVLGFRIHVNLPGVDTKYLPKRTVAIPISTQNLPQNMVTRNEQNVSVSWKAGKAWEILQDIKFLDITTAQAHGERGILLLLYVTE